VKISSFVPCFEAKAINPSPPDGGLLLIRSAALQIKMRLCNYLQKVFLEVLKDLTCLVWLDRFNVAIPAAWNCQTTEAPKAIKITDVNSIFLAIVLSS
jgi:hypothetical protein